jgi:Fe2+ or Zn2+ uptake regulation protein
MPMLKEKIMEVWKGVHSRGLSVTRRRSVVVELLVQVEHACGSCLMSLG